jgi:hypothetical protein
MESFEHLFRTIFAVFLDILTFTRLYLRPTTAVGAEIYFSESSSVFLSNGRSNHAGLPIRSDLLLPDCPAGLIGGKL